MIKDKKRISTDIYIPNYKFNGEYIYTSQKKYSMDVILELEKTIHDFEKYPRFSDLLKHINEIQFISSSSLRKLCYAMEHKKFEKCIDKYSKKSSSFNPLIEKYLQSYFKKYVINPKLYQIQDIYWDKIYVKGSGYLPYTIRDVIFIKNNLEYYAYHRYNRISICNHSNIHSDLNNLLYNLYNGVFDKWIELYQSSDYIYHKHKRKILSKNHRKILKFNGFTNKGNLIYASTNNLTTNYTIDDIIKLKDNLDDFEKYPFNVDLGRKFLHTSNSNIYNKVIWNIEEGTYDDWIKLYLNKSSDSIKDKYIHWRFSNKLDNVTPYNILGIANEIDNNGFLNSFKHTPSKVHETFFKYENNGKKYTTTFSKEDVIKINNAIMENPYSHISLSSFKVIVPDVPVQKIKKILKTLIMGGFDKYIE